MMKLVSFSLDVPDDLENFLVSLIRIRQNLQHARDADHMIRMKEQYNDTIDRMKMEVVP